MLHCPNCRREQEQGKFCGNCGTALETKERAQPTEQYVEGDEQVVPTETSPEVAQTTSSAQQEVGATQASTQAQHHPGSSSSDMQTGLKKYWDYSLNLLKRPGDALYIGEEKFIYSLVNIGLYALTFALIIYSLVNKQLGDFTDIISGLLGKVIFYTFLTLVVSLFLLLVCLLIAEKISVKKLSFKIILAQYGSLLIPFLYVHVAILLFSFVGASLVTIVLLNFSLFIVFLLLPGVYIYDKTIFYQSTPHNIYTAIGTVLLVIVMFFIVTVVFGMSALENMLDFIDNMYYYF